MDGSRVMDDKKIVFLDDFRAQFVGEAICLKCLYRYVLVMPEEAALRDVICPECDVPGAIIFTGQPQQ